MSDLEDDWRLRGQDKYLTGISLRKSRYESDLSNDHDHCVFCGVKFMDAQGSDVQCEGYCSTDRYHWVCEECFHEFKLRFNFQLLNDA